MLTAQSNQLKTSAVSDPKVGTQVQESPFFDLSSANQFFLLPAVNNTMSTGSPVSDGVLQLDRNAERRWFEAHPEPRGSVSGRRLILWNFPIDDAAVRSGHRAAIEQFIQRNSLAFLNSETEIEVIGHASESGTPAHNDTLSNDRADNVAAIVHALRPHHRTIYYGLGELRPIATGAGPEEMARNRCVEITILSPQRREVPEREDRWQQAKNYLESQLGGVTVGGGADVMWTPTITCVTRMIPVVPTPFGNPNPNAGTDVPSPPLCRDRPASSCMPEPHRYTVRNLGQMLERRFRIELETVLSESMVREVVTDFIHQCRQAKNRRDELLNRLNLGASQGGGRMVQRDREAYLNAERTWFENDPTCLWRYVNS